MSEVSVSGSAAFDAGRSEFVQHALQAVLEAEMTDFIGAAPGEHSPNRRGYRSGYRSRTLATGSGSIVLKVPRDRERRFATTLLSRFPIEEAATIAALTDMRVLGVSTDRVRAMVERLCGHGFSDEAIDRLGSELSVRLDPAAGSRLDDIDAVSLLHPFGSGAGSRSSSEPVSGSGVCRQDAPPKPPDPPPGAPMANEAPTPPTTSDAEAFPKIESPASPARLNAGGQMWRLRLRIVGAPSLTFAGLVGALVLGGILYGSRRGPAEVPQEPLRASSELDSGPAQALPMPSTTPPPGASTSPESHAAVTPPLRTSFRLAGVIAPPKPNGNGVALIAVDGSSPLPFRVGTLVEGNFVLLGVTRDGALLGPVNGPAVLTLGVASPNAVSGDVTPAREAKVASLGTSWQAVGETDATATEAAGRIPDALNIGQGPALRNSPGRRLRLNR